MSGIGTARSPSASALALAVLLAACLAVSGCAGSAAHGRTLTVLAASSLTETFGALEKRFEAEHSDVDVKLSFNGSSTLAEQVNHGAPADVFASADEANMARVAEAGNTATEPEIFATNRLSIVVEEGNSKGITGFRDLARQDIVTVMCAEAVPCGAAARKVQHATGVQVNAVSKEQNVKAVLHKVQAGEADAGLVYRTDARAGGDSVRAVDFPESAQAVNRYPIAVVRDAPRAGLAKEFVSTVLGRTGRKILADAGFGTP